MPVPRKNVVIIGSGFGATMTGLSLARAYKDKGKTILMLERGTWWTTPVATVQDKEIAAYEFLANKKEPVQYWSSQNHSRGFIDLFTRCYRRPGNEDGLYDMMRMGKPGFLGVFGGQNDGVSILRACGVGGGSLVYSNITIRPPNFIFKEWPISWTDDKRRHYYDLARHAIGYGVLSARDADDAHNIPYLATAAAPGLPPKAVNTGLSNIVTRSARINPHWDTRDNPDSSRPVHSIHIDPTVKPEDQLGKVPLTRYWIDRARAFQVAMSGVTSDYGAVDLAINDLTPEGTDVGPGFPPVNYPPFGTVPSPKNYCERQGRCNVGCLPGARHTLNKQLMQAAVGSPAIPPNPETPPLFPNLELKTLAEVDVIRALPEGGYEIRYFQRDQTDPSKKTVEKVTADVVIVSAGCVGTNEIMLRSKQSGTLPNLSERLGFGFSTNGDYIAFLEKTREHVSLTRGPVTTSYGHFNTEDPGTGSDNTGKTFHTLEDQGIPPALASLVGQGVPLIKSFGRGWQKLLVIEAAVRWGLRRLKQLVTAPFTNSIQRADLFRSEDEILAQMMCVVGIGRDAAAGRFRLGGSGETSLRMERTDGKKPWEDPIYAEIENSLHKVAVAMRDPSDPAAEFENPFLSDAAPALKSITVSHPLGGCSMGKDASKGVVDEFGHVFDTSKTGERPYYSGLYIADASMIPTALGVNPSLTISALSLRVADKILEEFPAK